MKKYKKPKITEEKVKLSFFLSNIGFLDSFNLVGTVYAQSVPSGDCDTYDCDCNWDCYVDCDCDYDCDCATPDCDCDCDCDCATPDCDCDCDCTCGTGVGDCG